MKRQLGCDFLISNLVSDIPVNLMKSIKKEALDKYLPNDRRPIKAWSLALASLRCLKRDLVKNRNKKIATYNKDNLESTTITPLFTNFSNSSMHQNFISSSSVDQAQNMDNALHDNSTNGFTSGLAENQTISSSILTNQSSKPLNNKKRVNKRN